MATKATTSKRTPRKAKKVVSPGCVLDGADSCPGVSGELNPYRYQKGCRGEACKTANREYYRAWRAEKKSAPAKKRVVKKATKKAVPAKKKVAAKKRSTKK